VLCGDATRGPDDVGIGFFRNWNWRDVAMVVTRLFLFVFEPDFDLSVKSKSFSEGLIMTITNGLSSGSQVSDFFSSVHSHSTSDQPFSKWTFREVSLTPVLPLHERILAVYKYIHDSGGHNLTTQYERCRTDAWVVQHEESRRLRVASRKCNQRWCPLCSKTKRWIITNSVAEWASEAKYPKFLTFTLKHSDASIELQCERLYDAFRDLRKRAWWKRKISGGVWFFQIKINKKTQEWHPHIHVLVDGDYIAKRFLKSEWLKLTFDSHIVDIKKVDDSEKAAEYIARYASAPADLLQCTVKQGAALVVGLKGRRVCGSFGSAKGIALRPKKMSETNPWRKVMSFVALRVGSTFDPYIKQIQDAFETGQAFDADLWGLYDTPDIPPHSMRYKPESSKQLLFEFDEHFYVNGRV